MGAHFWHVDLTLQSPSGKWDDTCCLLEHAHLYTLSLLTSLEVVKVPSLFCLRWSSAQTFPAPKNIFLKGCSPSSHPSLQSFYRVKSALPAW